MAFFVVWRQVHRPPSRTSCVEVGRAATPEAAGSGGTRGVLAYTLPGARSSVTYAAMRSRFAALVVVALSFSPALAPVALADDVAIPFTMSKLKNGMTVILHEDHALPIVTVHLAYKV